MRALSDMTSSVCPQPHGEGDPCTRHCLQIKGGVGDAKMDRNWSKVRHACAWAFCHACMYMHTSSPVFHTCMWCMCG